MSDFYHNCSPLALLLSTTPTAYDGAVLTSRPPAQNPRADVSPDAQYRRVNRAQSNLADKSEQAAKGKPVSQVKNIIREFGIIVVAL